jgi:hypothetical protein
MMKLNIWSNNFTKLISHKNIRCIKIMVRYMRNIRRISIRNMVSAIETLLLVLESVALAELDELFAI